MLLVLGVRLQSVVECMREGSNVALCLLPVAGVSDLGRKSRRQTLHQCTCRLSLVVLQITQAEPGPSLRHRLWTHAHRRVDFAIINIADDIFLPGVVHWSLHCSCRCRRLGHCCRGWGRQRGAWTTMPSRMYPTLDLGGSSIERSVGEAVRVAIRLAVNVVQRDPDHPRQLDLDACPKLAKARTACGEDATHLLDNKSAIPFNT